MQWTVAIGVDTHKDVHVAVAFDALGAQIGSREIATTAAGYRSLLGWARGRRRRVFPCPTHQRSKSPFRGRPRRLSRPIQRGCRLGVSSHSCRWLETRKRTRRALEPGGAGRPQALPPGSYLQRRATYSGCDGSSRGAAVTPQEGLPQGSPVRTPAYSRCPPRRSLAVNRSSLTEGLRCEDGRHRGEVAACERARLVRARNAGTRGAARRPLERRAAPR